MCAQLVSANVLEAWMCEYVEVYDTRSSRAWMFQCNQWFSIFRHPDGLTKRELYPQVMSLIGAPRLALLHVLLLVLSFRRSSM